MTSVSDRAAVAHLPEPAPGQRLRMTYEQYLLWAPESLIAEWADGEVVVAMPAKEIHQQVLGLLYVLLDLFVRARGLGVVRLAPMAVKLWPESGPAREPDIFVVRPDQLGDLGPDVFAGAPALAVEIISDDSIGRDREDKRKEYARAGVAEYWLIDPRPGVRRQPGVTLYHLDAQGQYPDTRPIHDGIVRSTVLPGFWLRAEWLWALPAPDPGELLGVVLRHPAGPEGADVPDALQDLPWSGALLERGEARGHAEGARRALRTIVRTRFGTLPADMDRRIEGADGATLDAWTAAAVQAPSLDDLLNQL
jgi:Uma2 family endonuclease